jgi:hypothetical protein
MKTGLKSMSLIQLKTEVLRSEESSGNAGQQFFDNAKYSDTNHFSEAFKSWGGASL